MNEQPVSAEIRRAAERIGYKKGARHEHEEWKAWAGGVLLRATDVLSEMQATQSFDGDMLDRLGTILWGARWEMGLQGGDKRIVFGVSSEETEVAS